VLVKLPIVQTRYSTYCCLVIMPTWYHVDTSSESPDIKKLEDLRGRATLKEALEKEINYWKVLKAKVP
jgi:hypothetical protein